MTRHVSTDDRSELHWWLSQKILEHAIERVVEAQQTRKPIEDCTKLEHCAVLIATQFDFLNQLTPFEYVLSQVYNDVAQTNTAQSPSSKSNAPVKWSVFRERLLSDVGVLAEIAKQTSIVLKQRGSQKGKPPKSWRNDCFTDLFIRLSEIGRGSPKELNVMARALWNHYFPKDKIMASAAAEKIVQREQNRRKSRRH